MSTNRVFWSGVFWVTTRFNRRVKKTVMANDRRVVHAYITEVRKAVDLPSFISHEELNHYLETRRTEMRSSSYEDLLRYKDFYTKQIPQLENELYRLEMKLFPKRRMYKEEPSEKNIHKFVKIDKAFCDFFTNPANEYVLRYNVCERFKVSLSAVLEIMKDYRPPSKEHSLTSETDNFNKFTRCDGGDFWEIRYNSHVSILSNYTGLRYIGLLIMDQKNWIHCRLLIPSRKEIGQNKEITDIELRVGSDDFSNVRTDKKAIMVYKKELRGLKKDKEKMEEEQRPVEEQEEIIDKIMRIEKVLRDAKYDHLTPEAKKLCNRVSKSIKMAFRKIDKKNPALAKHLKKSIKLGIKCTYDPADETLWKVEL
jgi:hypothetical protein